MAGCPKLTREIGPAILTGVKNRRTAINQGPNSEIWSIFPSQKKEATENKPLTAFSIWLGSSVGRAKD